MNLKQANLTALKCYEEHPEVLADFVRWMKREDTLNYREMMALTERLRRRNCPALLPIMLLSSSDPAAVRAAKRLFLRWARMELEANGGENLFYLIRQTLTEEHNALEK